MMLRYLPELRAMGAEVVFDLPPALHGLRSQRLNSYGPLGDDGDYFCPLLHLLHWLEIDWQNVEGGPYLTVNSGLVAKWREQLGPITRKRVGIAWSIGKPSDGDYPRQIALAQLVEALGDAELHSVQTQNDEASDFGVQAHEFGDFADCAALMSCMDEIVTVDTAALHLAGAIGHPRVFALLSHWASWRWRAQWYDNVRLCRQARPDDWASALAQVQAG
jgi:hypothetical protein